MEGSHNSFGLMERIENENQKTNCANCCGFVIDSM